jgi:hypothetical protein
MLQLFERENDVIITNDFGDSLRRYVFGFHDGRDPSWRMVKCILKKIRQSSVESPSDMQRGQWHHGIFPALAVVFVLLLPRPVATDSAIPVRLRARRAQEFVDQLRAELPIQNEIQIAVVTYHPLVFSVQPLETDKNRFLLTMELGFLLSLNDDELRAAVAHELGHVWIYTHHPFLQTERLANVIAQRVVDRQSFENIYAKLWMYEGASGVPIDDLLGPPKVESDVPPPVGSKPQP